MLSKLKPWSRGNLPLILAAFVVVAAVVGATFVIQTIADRETPLREAEVGLGELETLSAAMLMQPRIIAERGDAHSGDAAVGRIIRRAAVDGGRAVERNWTNDTSARILELSRRTAALNRRAIRRAVAGDLTAVERLLPELARRSRRLSAEVTDARAALAMDVDSVQSQERASLFAVTGGLGLALVLVMGLVSVSRRRRIRAEAERQEIGRSEERLQALVRHGSDMITVLSPDTTVLYEAGAVEPVLGYSPPDLEGRKLEEWVHPDDASSLLALCAAADAAGSDRELRLRHRDGSYRTCEARATSLLGDEVWNGIVLNIWDVSQRKELEERLRHQAFHDELTGLANRALFGDRLEHALQRAARDAKGVSVLLVDLDDFKAINDSLGHAAGDRLLEEVARRLSRAVRSADTIARLGGDEFGVIVEESSSTGADSIAAERIVAALSRPIRLDERAFPITASVGIARSEPGDGNADKLVRNADLAMYSAKAKQKGSIAVYRPDMHIATEERLQLKTDLVYALSDSGQLELYYQPVVSLEGKGIVGLEALLRWNHPTRGQIAPEDFVPVAEETGAIVPIGRWVLREACRQAAAWVRGRDLSISVNVSARQLVNPELIDDVRDALRDSGMPADKLVLELTETTLMRNVEEAAEVLRQIKRLGVRIAIDDFGTGYSSLSQLERLPVDILKVDREFAGTPRDRAEHAKLLRAVKEIGNSLHLRTVAEGIETPEQLEEMRALDYPLGQGFLFSRPLPVSAVASMLAEDRRAEYSEAASARHAPPDAPLGGEA
jgi:diguanylate cyclase (GGDEF)-like protein/PAS domain S-box-containing protein